MVGDRSDLAETIEIRFGRMIGSPWYGAVEARTLNLTQAPCYARHMPRRGDPEKIYQAQRAGIFMRLVTAERLDRLDAEHWIRPMGARSRGERAGARVAGLLRCRVAVDRGEPAEALTRGVNSKS